jgi:hypothetical protein
VLKPLSPKFYQSYKILWGNEGGRTKEKIYKTLQELDLISSPYKEKILIGGKVDLDLLSLVPQKNSVIIGGLKRYGMIFKINSGGDGVGTTTANGEEGAFL